jgi:hypothetical protein
LKLKRGKTHRTHITFDKNRVETTDSWWWRITKRFSFYSLTIREKSVFDVPKESGRPLAFLKFSIGNL